MADDQKVHSFKTTDHPTANGRRPQDGDVQWAFFFPIDDGSMVEILMGRAGRANLRRVVLAELYAEEGLPIPPALGVADNLAGDASPATPDEPAGWHTGSPADLARKPSAKDEEGKA